MTSIQKTLPLDCIHKENGLTLTLGLQDSNRYARLETKTAQVFVFTNNNASQEDLIYLIIHKKLAFGTRLFLILK